MLPDITSGIVCKSWEAPAALPAPLPSASGKLLDLQSHGYTLVKHISSKEHVSLQLLSSTLSPAKYFVAKIFKVEKASCLGKGELGPLQEIVLFKKLRHPHVVRYVQAWWSGSDGQLTLVMEHAEDGDLQSPKFAMWDSGRHLEQGLILRWLRQILDGLSYIHGEKVVHRDLKTANVFLKDKWRTALLGDFGISAKLNAGETFGASMMGTVPYMSPEMVRNETCTAAVDIWAVGIILYELMALKLPFAGAFHALIYQIAFSEPNERPLHAAGYSADLVALVTKVMAKDASARPLPSVLLENTELWADFSWDETDLIAMETYHAYSSFAYADGATKAIAEGKLGTSDDSWASAEPIRDKMEASSMVSCHVPASGNMSGDRSTMGDADLLRVAEGLKDVELRRELSNIHQSGLSLSPEQLSTLLDAASETGSEDLPSKR